MNFKWIVIGGLLIGCVYCEVNTKTKCFRTEHKSKSEILNAYLRRCNSYNPKKIFEDYSLLSCVLKQANIIDEDGKNINFDRFELYMRIIAYREMRSKIFAVSDTCNEKSYNGDDKVTKFLQCFIANIMELCPNDIQSSIVS